MTPNKSKRSGCGISGQPSPCSRRLHSIEPQLTRFTPALRPQDGILSLLKDSRGKRHNENDSEEDNPKRLADQPPTEKLRKRGRDSDEHRAGTALSGLNALCEQQREYHQSGETAIENPSQTRSTRRILCPAGHPSPSSTRRRHPSSPTVVVSIAAVTCRSNKSA
jgi:hypothetical protein